MTDDPETQPLSKYLSKKEKLLIITALSGEFPYNRSDRLDIGKEYERILRHRLYQEGIIKRISDDGLKGLVLTSKGVEVLKQKEPERYRYISDKKRTEISRRYRRQLFARTYCSLLNAGIEFLPDRKPFVFCPQTLAAVYCRFPVGKDFSAIGCSCFLQLHRDKI